MGSAYENVSLGCSRGYVLLHTIEAMRLNNECL